MELPPEEQDQPQVREQTQDKISKPVSEHPDPFGSGLRGKPMVQTMAMALMASDVVWVTSNHRLYLHCAALVHNAEVTQMSTTMYKR